MISAFYTSFEESNASKKDLIRRWIFSKIDYSGVERGQPVCFRPKTSFYHIELPDFHNVSPVFQTRILSALVDEDVRDDLERAGLINWCPNARGMVPLSVPRDGNCLLHAVGTAVWGIHDSDLMLRRVLGLVLGIDSGQRLHSRWRHYQQMQLSQLVERPVGWDQKQANREWGEITQCLDPDHSHSRAAPHRFLEAIHVYALANVLRRPIIIVTDPTLRTFSGLSLQDNDMGGIYLPLEWSWKETCRTPVLLAYTHCHFSPLVVAPTPSQDRREESSLVPLVNRRLQQLPVRFLMEGEGPRVGELLRRYLKIRETVMQADGRLQNILCTELERFSLPDELCLVKDYLRLCQQQFEQEARGFPSPPPQYQSGMSPEVGGRRDIRYQPFFPSSTVNQTPGSPQRVAREQVQRMQSGEFGLADPGLSGVWGEGQVHVPPPSFTPRVSFLEQNASLRPPQEKKCVVPVCKFFGDPDLGNMCSQCFRNYSMKESRQMAANRAFRPDPSAPLPTMQQEDQELQMSMMSERCRTNGCGFRCSRQTYPYCHECAAKIEKKKQLEAARAPEAGMAPGGEHPAAVASSEPPQEGSRLHTVSPLNDLNQPQAPSTPSPQSAPQSTEETSHGVVSPSAGENSSHSLSPTQVLAASSLLAPLTPVYDPSDKLLFGSGQPSPPPEHRPANVSYPSQTHLSPSPLTGQAEAWTGQPEQKMESTDPQAWISSPQPPSALGLAQEQDPLVSFPSLKERPTAGTSKECCKESCQEKVAYKGLCVKCYISKGMQPADPKNPTLNKLKRMSLSYSKQNSIPVSMGHSDVELIGSAPHTQVMEPASPVQGRNRASSLEIPPESAKQTVNNLNYVQAWVNESGRRAEESPISGSFSVSRNQPMGLPENQETEPLGNDLIASGLECCSPPRCFGEGCGNTVQEEGKLCEQCRDILRQFRQGQTSHTSLQESQADQYPCRTEGCPFFGIKDNLYHCTSCYTRLVSRELEEQARHAPPPAARHTHTLSSRPSRGVAQQHSTGLSLLGGQHGAQCRVPGCSMYGDPKQADMCSTHYQQHLAHFVTPPPPQLAGYRGLDSLSMQTASLGNQYESHQRRPLQVVDPASRSTSTMIQHGRTTTQRGLHQAGGNSLAGVGSAVRSPPVVSSLPPSSILPPGQQGWGVPSSGEDLSLGATYNRLVTRDMVKCLNPSCSNYGNPRKGGVCNSCAEDEIWAKRLIYGEEENG